MSYKENSDYININLKRTATEDELQVLNYFWNIILPNRYIKGINKKLCKKYSKDLFFEKCLNHIKIKNRKIFIKSISNSNNNAVLGVVKKSIVNSVLPDGILISEENKNNDLLKEWGKYFYTCGIPVAGFDINNSEKNERADIFSVSMPKISNIKKNKIKNSLNIVIVGSHTLKNDEEYINNAFLDKKLADLTLSLYREKLITASEDCEYGIFTAIIKLIRKHKWGMFVNLDNLHKSEPGLKAWEYLTSEGGERIIYAVPNRKLVDFLKFVDKYELDFSIIGKTDKSKSIRVVNNKQQVIHLNKKLILNPLNKICAEKISDSPEICVYGENISEENIHNIIFSKNFTAKKSAYKNFDGIIGNKTDFQLKDNGIAELWYPDIKSFISFAVHSNALQFKFDRYISAQNAVCEAVRKIIAFGHDPIGVYINCSFDFSNNTDKSKILDFINGIKHSSKKLKIKINNIVFSSSPNEGFSIVVFGKKKKHNKLFVPYFENAQKVYVIGKPDDIPATSLYQQVLGENIYPHPDSVNYKFEKRLLKCIKKLQKANLISAITPVDRFGIAGALAKSLSVKRLGFKCERHDFNLNYLFNEIQSRFLIASNKNIEQILKRYKIPFVMLGKTKTADFLEFDGLKISCEEFYSKYFNITSPNN